MKVVSKVLVVGKVKREWKVNFVPYGLLWSRQSRQEDVFESVGLMCVAIEGKHTRSGPPR